MSKKPRRLSMADFNVKAMHAAGGNMPIIFPNGKDSGEWLTVRGPDCDEAIQAHRQHARARFAITDSLLPMKEQIEALDASKQNWFEYNTALNDAMIEPNISFVCAIVAGWSLTEDFTRDNLTNFLRQFPGAVEQVTKFHAAAREKLDAK